MVSFVLVLKKSHLFNCVIIIITGKMVLRYYDSLILK